MGNQASRMRRQRVDFSLAFIHFYFIYFFFLGKNSVQSCLNQLGPARIFLNPQLFLSSFKNFHVYTNPKRIRIHCSTQDSSENIGNRACVVKTGRRENLETGGCHLEYSIHVKELGQYLFRHRIKKISGFVVHTILDSQGIQNFSSGERIQKVANLFARFTGYVWTEAENRKKKLRIKKYPGKCGQGFSVPQIFFLSLRKLLVLLN